MEEIISLTIKDTFNIEGRGMVFVVEKEGSPVPLRNLRRAKINVAGKIYYVRGMECWCLPEGAELNVVGLLVKEA